MQVWSKSTHSFRKQGADKPIFNRQTIFQQLKMRSRSPKSNQFFSMSQQYRCTSLVKIHSFIHSGEWVQTSPLPTMGSRSPKSNQFFYMSQQYRCASLDKIHLFLQEKGCRQAIFQQSKPLCDFENRVKATKI